jgi:hypothetical protein
MNDNWMRDMHPTLDAKKVDAINVRLEREIGELESDNADLEGRLAAANRIIAEQDLALATAHSALLMYRETINQVIAVIEGQGGPKREDCQS